MNNQDIKQVCEAFIETSVKSSYCPYCGEYAQTINNITVLKHYNCPVTTAKKLLKEIEGC